MILSDEVLDALVAAGATPEMIAAAVKAANALAQRRIEPHRARNAERSAERMRRKRARDARKGALRQVTP